MNNQSDSNSASHQRQEQPLSQKDSELAQAIANTLDNSVNDIDELTVLRLKKSRAQALTHSHHPKRHWVPLSVAASIIMLVAIPALWQKDLVSTTENADTDLVFQEVPLAAQEVDDMDMLIAMDDNDA